MRALFNWPVRASTEPGCTFRQHQFSKWEVKSRPVTPVVLFERNEFYQERSCVNCGFVQQAAVVMQPEMECDDRTTSA